MAQNAAMGALQKLFTAEAAPELDEAIVEAERLPLVPAEALRVSRERLRLLRGGAPNAGFGDGGGLYGGIGSGGDAGLQAQMKGMMQDLQNKMDSMGDMQSKLQKMQADKEAMEEENRRLRAAASRRSSRAAGGGDDSDDEAAADREVLTQYTAARDTLMQVLACGKGPPSAAQYGERNLLMHRLSDADLQAEYQWYTQLCNVAAFEPLSIRPSDAQRLGGSRAVSERACDPRAPCHRSVGQHERGRARHGRDDADQARRDCRQAAV
eukprot:2229110-Prymnesium_polylepis.1